MSQQHGPQIRSRNLGKFTGYIRVFSDEFLIWIVFRLERVDLGANARLNAGCDVKNGCLTVGI